MIKRRFYPVLLALTLTVLVSRGSAIAGPRAAVERGFKSTRTVLDNGLTVLITEMPDNPMVSLYALVRAGSATEGRFLGSGISHFLEHLMFKGTHSQAVGEIAASIQAIGGTINASTGMDFTIYTVTVPAEFFTTAMEVLADMIQNPGFDPGEIEKEREVVFREIIMNEDNPRRELISRLFETAYLNHPYRLPVIGFRPVLEGISRDDVTEYYREFYSPNNMVFSVAGNVRAAEASGLIAEAFAGFRRRQDRPRNLPVERARITPRYFEKEFSTQVALVAMSFPGVSLLDPDLFALDILAKIIGQGRASRLHQALYENEEEKLVYAVTAWNHTPVDPGLFVIQAELDDSLVEKVNGVIRTEIDRVRNKGVSAGELKRAKRQVVSEYVQSRLTTGGVAHQQAVDQAFAGDHGFSARYVELVQQVSREDIARVAGKYLEPSALSTVVIRPRAAPEGEPEGAEEVSGEAAGAVEKTVLENGLTVLTRRDPALPWVNFQLVMQGGSRQEDASATGLSRLLQSVWIRGTKSMSAKEIDELVESRGMVLDAHAGRNSVGLSLACLGEDIDAALGLLADIALQPAFAEDQVSRARDDQLAAIDRQRDDIFQFTGQALREALYPAHPMRFNLDGTRESVEALTRDDLAAYHRALAVPSNMVLAVYGDIDPVEITSRVKKLFAARPPGKTEISRFTAAALAEAARSVRTLPKQQAMLMIGFHGPDMFAGDRYAVELAASVLGSSFSGRLFNTVREEFGEAYSVGGAFIPGLDTGMVYFYVLTVPESIPKVEELARAEIKRLSAEPVSEKELRDMKNYLAGTFQGSLQTNAALALTTALDEAYGLGHDNYRSYREGLEAVTPGDVSRAARTYLDLDKAVTAVTLPDTAAVP
jgi:zinc protease